MFDALKNAPCRAVGAKQVLRAISGGTAQKVYLAQDVEDYLSEKVLSACREAGVEAERCGSMKELGKACGIEVQAACAAILRL